MIDRKCDPADRGATIERLVRRMEHLECRPANGRRLHATGIAGLDSLFPEQGIRGGTLIEWLGEGPGSGAGTLVFTVAAHLVPCGASCVVIDPRGVFYPPAAHRLGNDFDRMIVVHPRNAHETIWAIEQSLRCVGVSAVVCWIDRLDAHVFRRLKLAAETGGGVGLLLRPAKHKAAPSWADVRLLVRSLPCDFDNWPAPTPRQAGSGATGRLFSGRRLQVELIHFRGRMSGGLAPLEIDDETGDVHLASRLADPADSARAAGA